VAGDPYPRSRLHAIKVIWWVISIPDPGFEPAGYVAGGLYPVHVFESTGYLASDLYPRHGFKLAGYVAGDSDPQSQL
jgi:hypothetical protein